MRKYEYLFEINDNQKKKLSGLIPFSDATTSFNLQHRWQLPGNYPVFNLVMVVYHYVETIWIILVTPNFLYNIYDR